MEFTEGRGWRAEEVSASDVLLVATLDVAVERVVAAERLVAAAIEQMQRLRENHDALLAAVKAVVPSLQSLVAQDCPDPDVAAHDIAMRDLALDAITRAEAG